MEGVHLAVRVTAEVKVTTQVQCTLTGDYALVVHRPRSNIGVSC
jgi:hypothetical protein